MAFRRKRDFQDVVYAAGAQFNSVAVQQTISSELERELVEGDAPDYEDMLDDGHSVGDHLHFIGSDLLCLGGGLSGPGSRGRYDQIAKCRDFFPIALSWPDREFRHTFRVSRLTFDRLVHLLEKNPIFTSTGRKPQRPVRFQLACFLMRYGKRGSDAMQVSKELGIGFGSVFLYCRRVSRALREIGLEVISWGDEERHKVVSDHIALHYGFRNCIGIVDGTLIRLTESPRLNGVVYFCRKKYPAINVQGIVDHKKRFISFDMGWPGSVSDATVWKRSHLWTHRHQYFKDGEYILADKGYPSSPYALRPFTDPEVFSQPPDERDRRKQFNRRVSSIRIRVEHPFGRLKGCFPALKELGTPDNMQDVYHAVQAMMVIHNLCIDLGDSPEDIPCFDPSDEDVWPEDEALDIELPDYGGVEGLEHVNIPEWELQDEALKEAGHRVREQILDELFPR